MTFVPLDTSVYKDPLITLSRSAQRDTTVHRAQNMLSSTPAPRAGTILSMAQTAFRIASIALQDSTVNVSTAQNIYPW